MHRIRKIVHRLRQRQGIPPPATHVELPEYIIIASSHNYVLGCHYLVTFYHLYKSHCWLLIMP